MQDTRGSAEDLHDERDEEQVDLDGDEEAEEIMDEEAEDEGDVEEEEKNRGQEGLDLDLVEDEGSGSQDEQEAEQNVNVSNVDHEKLSEDDGNNDTVAVAGKGLAKVAGGHDDFMNVSKFKDMTLHDCKSNMDAFGPWTDFTGQNVSSPSDQGNQLLNIIKLESDEREACNIANDGQCSDFDLRWKSSRKRQRAGDSAFLSRSPTSCGKEESKRFNGSKLVDTDGIENDSESLLGRNTEDVANGQEGPMEGKNLKQGHENLKPMHGASINESLFISSMPVANLVMSR